MLALAHLLAESLVNGDLAMTLADDLYAVPPQTDLPQPVLLDRSTLERYAACPAQGLFAETHPELCGSPEAMSGTLAHEVFAWVLTEYALHRWPSDGEPPWDTLVAYARHSRPDLQPDVLDAIRPAIYSWSRWVLGRSPDDFHRFAQVRKKHGEDRPAEEQELGPERSGQLAREILPARKGHGAVLATSELDTLVRTPSEVVFDEVDYKTGHTPWTLDTVAKSFQFRLHAFLVFGTYKDLDKLRVSIWMTRKYTRTSPVTFRRRDADDMTGLLQETVEHRRQALALPEGEQPEAWNKDPAKCRICPCLLDCPKANHIAFRLASDPVAFASDTELLRLQVEEREAQQTAYVDAHGPIAGSGWSVDRHAPKTRKPACKYKETS